MYHTMELHLKISGSQYYKFKNQLFILNDIVKQSTWENRKTRHIECKELSFEGISLIKLVKLELGRYFGLWVKINPKVLIEQGNYTDVMRAADSDHVLARINELMSRLLGEAVDFSESLIDRIDACANIAFEKSELAKRYMALLRRGRIPWSFEQHAEYSKMARRFMPNPNAFYLLSPSRCINIYDKYSQANQKSHMEGYDYPGIERMKGIIRIEIQLFRPEVLRLMKKLNISNMRSFLVRGDEIAAHLFCKYLPKLYGTGDFFRIGIVKELLLSDMSGVGTFRSRQLVEFATIVNRLRSLDAGIKVYQAKKEIKNQAMKRMIQCFDGIKISPITIPKEWGINYLPNPLALVLGEIDYGWSRISPSDSSFSPRCNQ